VDFDEIRILVPMATHAHLRPACSGKLQCPMEENTIPFYDFPGMLNSGNCPSAAIELVPQRPRCDQLDVSQTARHLFTSIIENR